MIDFDMIYIYFTRLIFTFTISDGLELGNNQMTLFSKVSKYFLLIVSLPSSHFLCEVPNLRS